MNARRKFKQHRREKAKFSHYNHPRKKKKMLINKSSLSISTKSNLQEKKYLKRHEEATNFIKLSTKARLEALEM